MARPPAPHGAYRLARCATIEDVARVARRRLPLGARAYLENGGEGQHTLHRNRAAFGSYTFRPRQPRDVSGVDTGTTVLGQRIPLPFALSPVGAPRMFHHDGELAVARAARDAGIPYGISTLANTSVEDVAEQTDSPLWFQLYIWGDRSKSKEAVARAKAAGYQALLVNIDTSVRSERIPEKHSGLVLPSPQLPLKTLFEGALHPAWAWNFLTSPTVSFPNIGPPDQRSLEVMSDMFDGTVCWDDLDWIRRIWDGPIVLKGVTTVEQAREAVDHGLDAVIVSNHGGRQLDRLPATIDVLPEIADAVGDRVEVLVDSGFRSGGDIATALALGAKAVLVGRAHLYGLAAAGEAGVRHCVDILARELRMTMQLNGARNIAELDRGLIHRRGSADPAASAASALDSTASAGSTASGASADSPDPAASERSSAHA
ncbi:alpha-hydroxy acid oxidase [Catenulispora acidiphila]|uniref:alpha-hydroxy acid oxidase n=1 Tax=Catenulispora acidiphila TaxID=304895 RepID=UPI0002E5CEBA|nr:alpha-hydroxy acid oxidase [Catenulispora acidiphila]